MNQPDTGTVKDLFIYRLEMAKSDLRSADLLMKYDMLSYIDVCYEKYNSTGNQGIIDDLRDYVEMQGGRVD